MEFNSKIIKVTPTFLLTLFFYLIFSHLLFFNNCAIGANPKFANNIGHLKSDKNKHFIASSPPGSIYSLSGQIIADKLDDEKLDFVSLDNGGGSIDNLRALLSGKASFAIIRSDLLFFLASGKLQTSDFSSFELTPLSVVPLYTEVLHMLVRRPLNPSSINDFSDYNFYVGGKESGLNITIETAFDSLGLNDYRERIIPLSQCCAYNYFFGTGCGELRCPKDLPRPDIIAIMSIPGFYDINKFLVIPNRYLDFKESKKYRYSETQTACLTYLFSIAPDNIERVTSNFPIYKHYRTKPGFYFKDINGEPNFCASLDASIETIGIKTLLITHSGVDTLLIKEVLSKLYPENKNNLSWIIQEKPIDFFFSIDHSSSDPIHIKELVVNAFSEINISQFFKGLESIPFHPGVNEFFEGLPLWKKTDIKYFSNIAILLFLSICSIFALLFWWEAIGFYWHRNRSQVITLIIFFTLLISGSMTYTVESDVNTNFANIRESAWSILTWLLSGFEDRPPKTLVGQISSVFFLAAWAALLLLLINFILKERMQALIEEDHVPMSIKNHYVICGWNERAVGIIRQLRGDHQRKRNSMQYVIVIAPEKDIGNTKRIRNLYGEILRDVIFLRADPTDKKAISKAKVERATSIVVLADDNLGITADGKTALIISGLDLYINSFKNDRYKLPFRITTIIKIISSIIRKDLSQNKIPTIIGEFINSENRKRFFSLSEKLESLDIATIDSNPIAQMARTPGLPQFFFDLLSITPETNELYLEEIPDQLKGLTFSTMSNLLLKLRILLSQKSFVPPKQIAKIFKIMKHKKFSGSNGNSLFHLGLFRFLPESTFRLICIGLKDKNSGCVCIWPNIGKISKSDCKYLLSDKIPKWDKCDLLVISPDKPDLLKLLKYKKIRKLFIALREDNKIK